MSDHLNELVAQSFIAALVVEALLRLWDVRSPHQRVWWRLGALAGPVVLLPLFEALAPFRHAPWFADGPALFATGHLGALTLLGVGVDRLWPWPVWALGALLLARDLGPLLSARGGWAAAGPSADVTALSTLVASVSGMAGVAPPPIVVVPTPWPVLLCVGAHRPRLLVSPALLARLDEGELRAAVAHELSHLRHHDVLWSWLLLGARAVQVHNPVAQVLGRLVALETELRADADAAAWTGQPAALASALLEVCDAPRTPDSAGPVKAAALARDSTARAMTGRAPGGRASPRRSSSLFDRLEGAHALALEERCRRLLDPPLDPGTAPGPVVTAATALALTTLLFFVT